jgi:hypothetical protein
LKIEGTCSKAVLHGYTLAVPWCITVCGRWGTADVGAIYSTQSMIEEGEKLGWVSYFRRGGQINLRELHICDVEGGCRKQMYNLFKIPGNKLERINDVIDTHLVIVLDDHWKHSPMWVQLNPVTTV